MSTVKITRINNFVCPACGEVMRQVAARDGVVKGWCPQAKQEINFVVCSPEEEAKACEAIIEDTKNMSYLETLKATRAKVLKDVVSAREDGDLKENSAYHAAREQLSILDDKIRKEQNRLRQLSEVETD